MILIKKLQTKLNKNGNITSYGLFFCEYCEQYVERPLSYKNCKSCGCMKSAFVKGENNPFYGKKHTEETRQLMKDNHADFRGENHPMYGKKHTEEVRQNMRDGQIGKHVGEKNNFYGKKHSEESNKKNSESNKGKKVWNMGVTNKEDSRILNLQKHPNWQNGKSFEIYPQEFNKELKQFIKDRDLNVCQMVSCMNMKDLCIHHIDYDKKNIFCGNLITLCRGCHTKTNYNRKYWVEYYSEIVSVYL